MVALFVKPLFEAMAEQNKGAQAGAAVCLAKVVECAFGEGGSDERCNAVGFAFQKLVPRICKLLGGQSFLSKASLLLVVSSLSQVNYFYEKIDDHAMYFHQLHECSFFY